MIPNVLPGEQKTLTHFSSKHALMTVVYQCMYVLPKHAKIPMADGTTVDLEHGLRISKRVYFGKHVTEAPELYITKRQWTQLQDELCPLCHRHLDGRDG